MTQLQLNISAGRRRGERLADQCAGKAERVSAFDSEGASLFILGWLRRHGSTSGEQLVSKAIAHGYHAHDKRAFGAVFKMLVQRGLIKCLRSDLPRELGHGTSGGKLWAAVAKPGVKLSAQSVEAMDEMGGFATRDLESKAVAL